MSKLVCAVLLSFICMPFIGCHSWRCGVVARVDDVGAEITTRYRYRVVRSSEADRSDMFRDIDKCHVVYEMMSPGSIMGEYSHDDSPYKNEVLKQIYPQVFSDDGIEIKIRRRNAKAESKYSWTGLLGFLSIGLFPTCSHTETTLAYEIEIPRVEKANASFATMYFYECADSMWPTAYLAFDGKPNVGEGRLYHAKGDVSYGAAHIALTILRKKAFAYAVAKRLKELEDAGVIDAIACSHRIERLSRDPQNGFAYDFALKLQNTPLSLKDAARAALRDFAKAVVEDYVDMHPHAKKDLLRVAFSDIAIAGVMISGKASVLTIAPLSLSYDTNTRRGKLSVRFNSGQVNESRKWVLENIGTLARDKNIMLTTGVLPPPGKISICGEKSEDNVFEIEFKTE